MHLETADGKQISIQDGFVLGRVAGSGFVLTDTKASRRHACIHVSGSLAEIEDLESHNGTLLNGKPVTRHALCDGDEIQIGTTVVRFREGAVAKGPPSAGPLELDLAPPPVTLTQLKPAPRDVEVIEFLDEVVQVRASEPTKPSAPGVRGKPADPAPRRAGVLQFTRQKQGPALLGDDLAQMSPSLRLGLYTVVLVIAIGLGWLVMRLVR